jgi:hypothetical protein
VLVSLIAIGGVVAYLIVQGSPSWGISVPGTGGSRPSGGGSVVAPKLRAVTAYDPFGSPPGQEHNADAPKATDSDPNSYWETERYSSSFAALGKKGVGLVLDAGKDVQLQQLGFATQTPGFTAVIRGGNTPTGPFSDLSAPQNASRRTQYTLSGGKYRYYLIWITSLPPANGAVRINEVTAG